MTLKDKNGAEIGKYMQDINTAFDTSAVDVPNDYELVLYKDEAFTEKYDKSSPVTENITLYADFTESFKGTQTEISFTITPINIEIGNTVILALYNGDNFVKMQSAVYTGEAIPFTITEAYTNAKVMVWENFENMIPACNAEIIK